MITEEEELRQEEKAYHDLITDGWVPSHSLSDIGFGALSESGQHLEIYSYWLETASNERRIFVEQWKHWQNFRKHQDWIRTPQLHGPGKFEEYSQAVRVCCTEKGFQGNISLLKNRAAQTTLDDWKNTCTPSTKAAKNYQRL